MMKANLSKILFGISAVLLICFLGGLVYITYDYNTNLAYTYGSTPLYVYYYIHGFIFLVPSVICFIVSLVLKSKSKIKS